MLQVAGKAKRSHLLQTQPFASTFGQQAQRKRPRLASETYDDLLRSAQHTDDQCAPPHHPSMALHPHSRPQQAQMQPRMASA